MHISDIQYKLY